MDANNNEQDYTRTDAEREEGHVDTIKGYFNECEGPLGCDPGVDIPG